MRETFSTRKLVTHEFTIVLTFYAEKSVYENEMKQTSLQNGYSDCPAQNLKCKTNKQIGTMPIP